MWSRKIATGLLGFSVLVGSSFALAEDELMQSEVQEVQETQKMELTKKQQKQVAPYVQKVFESKREAIKKYMEIGAIDQEKGERMLKKLAEKEQKLKDRGYSLSCMYKRRPE